ncbi:MAG: OmpA family protein [Bdellovibrionales bacterium]|nr:OmpA family protein [Bdellovibrionales bacterium]
MKSHKVVSILMFVFLGVSAFGCAQPISKATQGALAGAALGAGTGAIVGNQTGHSGAGIAIGAGLGALGGAIAGNSLDRMDQENAALEGQLRENQARLEENQRLIDELRSRGADVRSTKRGVVVNLPDILFEFDRANLTPEAVRTLGEIGEVVRTVKDRPIAVEGHTDSIGTVTYNRQLSERRADSVARELSHLGVPRNQMSVRGYGEGQPIATNNSEAGRARNRRVEIIIEN